MVEDIIQKHETLLASAKTVLEQYRKDPNLSKESIAHLELRIKEYEQFITEVKGIDKAIAGMFARRA